ncbi:VanZ family protein [Candidatus Laterigemmans baculatus]|uniref:VanZ family protein n=1 Tax=Candidatus Laterigemmans baculatus TaxID=2770505 RepID=UPI0036F42EA8
MCGGGATQWDHRSTLGLSSNRGDWAVNYLLTVPLAFWGVGAYVAPRSGGLRFALAAVGVLAAVLAMSCGVEFAQLWCEGRYCSVRDVVAQSAGAAGGVALWGVAGGHLSRWRDSSATRQSVR